MALYLLVYGITLVWKLGKGKKIHGIDIVPSCYVLNYEHELVW